MVSHLQMVSIFVTDLENALDFYVNQLGFEKTAEFDDTEGTKLAWVVPRPAASVELATEIALCEVSNDDPRVGSLSGMVFTAEDIEATYLELIQRGVQFTKNLIRHNYGEGKGDQEAQFVDPDGNVFLLHT